MVISPGACEPRPELLDPGVFDLLHGAAGCGGAMNRNGPLRGGLSQPLSVVPRESRHELRELVVGHLLDGAAGLAEAIDGSRLLLIRSGNTLAQDLFRRDLPAAR